jgi:hypothetical protein
LIAVPCAVVAFFGFLETFFNEGGAGCGCISAAFTAVAFVTGTVGIVQLVKWAWTL